jgi:hypothetical protein
VEVRIPQPAEIDRLLLPWLAMLSGLALGIASFYLEYRRRHPAPAASAEARGRAGAAKGIEPRLSIALGLLLLGWLLRYAADRLGGGWALAGHATALAGIAMLARAVAIRRRTDPSQQGGA